MAGHGEMVMYGAPPVDPTMPRFPQVPDVGTPLPQRPIPFVPFVDPPPPYAADAELSAMAALVKLDDESRKRILRWAVSRWGTP